MGRGKRHRQDPHRLHHKANVCMPVFYIFVFIIHFQSSLYTCFTLVAYLKLCMHTSLLCGLNYPFSYASGDKKELVGIISEARDITAKKAVERELLRKNEELQTLCDDPLNHAFAQLIELYLTLLITPPIIPS